MKKVLFLTSLLFLTGVNAQTTLMEGFETWPLTNWTFAEIGDALDGWRDTFDGTSNTGSKAAYAAIDNAQCDNWMISPAVTIASSNYQLSFWELSGTIDIEFYDSATVLISTGSNDPNSGDFTTVFETELNTDNFEERTISLASYVDETIYIAFRYQGTYHRWYVDDVSVAPDDFIDGELMELVSPTGVSDVAIESPVIVTVQNNGTTALTDFSITWKVNEDEATTDFDDTTLEPGQIADLNLGNYVFGTEGYYDIEAILVVNEDFNAFNDTIRSTFEVSSFKDGRIASISPEGLLPNAGIVDVIIEVENIAETTIDRLRINWDVDGVPQPQIEELDIEIIAGSTYTIVLGQANFGTGRHTISATIDVLGDTNDSNDFYEADVAVNQFVESFEGTEFPPEGWCVNFGTRDGINFGSAVDGEFYYVSSVDNNFFGEVSDTILTPLLDIQAGNRFQFYIQSSLATSANYDLVWKDGETGEINFIQSISPSPGFNNWALRNYDISAAAGTNYIGIIATSTGSYGESRFDFFTSDAKLHLFDHDLKIRNGDIHFLARQNQEEQFECKIRNAGNQAVLGSEYTLKLMEAPGVEIASIGGVNLNTWEETTLVINETFTAVSNKHLYFEIDYNNDENLANNRSRTTLVGIVPNNAEVNNIGAPTLRNGNIPFTPNGNTNSLGEDDLTQSLYYADEFNTVGYVHGIAYKYDNLIGAKEAKKYPLQVWITQSNVNDLDQGWAPQESLQLVFDGEIDILPGNNRDLYIPFNEPVLLNGTDNVVIQNHQYDPSWPPAIFRMLSTNLGFPNPTRSIGVFDVFDLDPASPPDFFATLVDIPFTRFVVEPIVETATLSGVVSNSLDNSPLSNVLVSIVGSSISTITDNNGNYSFAALPYGNYEVRLESEGFLILNQELELNSPSQAQDFFLTPREELQVVGRVVGNNDLTTPLASVTVQIVQEGTVINQAVTNANGNFSFPSVFSGFEYELFFYLYGYEEKTVDLSLLDSSVNLTNVILVEELISPFDVQVAPESDPVVTWKSPKLSSKVQLKYDRNVRSFSYTNEPNENAWLGNYFSLPERTTITSVEIQTDIYLNAEDFVTIDIIDVEQDSVLATSEPFIIYADSIHVINVPNIVVDETIAVMVHWQNNPASTNALALDFSDENIFNAAVVKFPGQAVTLLSDFLGSEFTMAFHVRVNTLEDDTPVTNEEPVTYNVYRGLASEFPDITNWEQLNDSPLPDLSFIDINNSTLDPSEFYQYAVAALYETGISEVTFSNLLAGRVVDVVDFEHISSKIALFPLPTKDELTISFEQGLSVDQTLEIYDVNGKLVTSMATPLLPASNNVTIKVDHLKSGTYFLKMIVNGINIVKKIQVM